MSEDNYKRINIRLKLEDLDQIEKSRRNSGLSRNSWIVKNLILAADNTPAHFGLKRLADNHLKIISNVLFTSAMLRNLLIGQKKKKIVTLSSMQTEQELIRLGLKTNNVKGS